MKWLKDRVSRMVFPHASPERREIYVSMVRSSAFAMAALFVVVLAAVAWFTDNSKVTAGGQGDSYRSVEIEPSLFIAAGAVSSPTDHLEVVNIPLSGGLVPVSTANMENWWRATDWDGYVANAYTIIAGTASGTDVATSYSYMFTYTNAKVGATEEEELEAAAYNTATYTLYTDKDALDVYFAPDGVSLVAEENSNYRQLAESLRIGIRIFDGPTTGGEPVKTIIYAPYPESGTGNSSGVTDVGYYAVTDTASVTKQSGVIDDLSSCTATGTDGVFTAEDGTDKLLTADTKGTAIQIYVWIEGTDAQAVVGKSDSASGVHLQLHFAGVMPPEED